MYGGKKNPKYFVSIAVYLLAVKTNPFYKLAPLPFLMTHHSYNRKVPVAVDVPVQSNVLADPCK